MLGESPFQHGNDKLVIKFFRILISLHLSYFRQYFFSQFYGKVFSIKRVVTCRKLAKHKTMAYRPQFY